MAAFRHLEFGKKLQFWSRELYRHVILHICSKFRDDRPIWHRDIAKKTIFNMASVRHVEFEKFQFCAKFACSEWKFAPVYQIWSKSDNSRLRYGDKAIFNMAVVRHLEFAKIAVLVTWPISACDPSFLFQNSRWSANIAPKYSQKTIFQYGVRPPSWIWKISIFCQMCMLGMKICIGVPNLIEIG